MNTFDYQPNSHKFKEEQKETQGENKKRVEKVVSGAVKVKKKSNFASAIISEDAKSVKNYVLMDVLVPAFKKLISDIVTDGIDIILYGGTNKGKKRGNIDYVSYNKFAGGGRDDHRDFNAYKARTGYSYDDIKLESRGEAEAVLRHMGDLIETYGVVSVADLYDLVGESHNYTDNKYGWTNLRNAEPVRARGGGYLLSLPKALPID